VYFEILGSPIIVLNTVESANELLDKRATNYSHRPIFQFLGELVGENEVCPSRVIIL